MGGTIALVEDSDPDRHPCGAETPAPSCHRPGIAETAVSLEAAPVAFRARRAGQVRQAGVEQQPRGGDGVRDWEIGFPEALWPPAGSNPRA